MIQFHSLPLKLAVIDALIEQNLLKKEIAALRRQFPEAEIREYYEKNPTQRHIPHPGVLRYFTDLDLPAGLLARVKDLSFEGGNEIYRVVIPEWDGEDEQFTVRDFTDLLHLPNLRSLRDTVLVDVADARVLLELQNLKSVDANFGSAIRDEKTLAALEKAGVKIENKPEVEKKSAPNGPDPKLRLALDYERAQELLWDEGKPAEALRLLEKCLAQHPGDADCWFEKGNALDELDKREEAVAAWLHCLTLGKKNPDAHYNLANYYKDKGDVSNAWTHIDAAIADGMKSSPEAWHIRGQLQLATGKKSTAEGDLQKALKLYEESLDDEDERAENLFQIACVHALLGDSGKAKDFLGQAIGLDASFRKRAKEDSDLAGVV